MDFSYQVFRQVFIFTPSIAKLTNLLEHYNFPIVW